MRSVALSCSACVITGRRPGGSSSIAQTAMSPCTARASVRGMGVAVMASTWGGGVLFSCRRARWPTPNLQATLD